jgi:hypothetical protein
MFILGDCCMRDALVLVEDGVGEHDTLSAKLKAAVRKGVTVDVFTSEVPRHLVPNQDDPLPPKREGQLFADVALIAQTNDVTQAIWFGVHRPVQVVSAAWAFANLALYRCVKLGRNALAASMSEIPRVSDLLCNCVLVHASREEQGR